MKEHIEYGSRHDYSMMISHMKAPDTVKFNDPFGATYYISKLHDHKYNTYQYIFKVMYGNNLYYIVICYTLKDIVDHMIEYESLSHYYL